MNKNIKKDVYIVIIIPFVAIHSILLLEKCVCNLNVTLTSAKSALDYMIQKLRNDTIERFQNKDGGGVIGETCYNPIEWDKNAWECPKKPEEPEEDIVETTPAPQASLLVKSLK